MRRLSGDEKALWDKVVASVRPLHLRTLATPEPTPAAPEPVRPVARPSRPEPEPVGKVRLQLGATLDGGWDKRLGRGLVQPDATVDLHGHNLQTAYTLLDQSLDRSIGRGDRVILLVTGKPPKDDRRPVGRGAIRAAIGDWLGSSRHAGSIAAVRNAHPRHGGSGALYIVIRRKR